MSLVELVRRPDGVAIITMANGKVNAISQQLRDELLAIALELHANPPGAVVITGGEKIFAAGADISEFGDQVAARRIGASFHRTFDAVAAIPCMVIAAVAGYALGGGCELALACDYRVASTRAVFGQPEILLGIIPGGGGTQRLTRLVGASKAKIMVLAGGQIKAPEALAMGLCDEVVDHELVNERAVALASELARGALVAQRLAKKAIDDGLAYSLGVGLALEQELFVDVFATHDAAIGVTSFLANGPGKAEFTGA